MLRIDSVPAAGACQAAEYGRRLDATRVAYKQTVIAIHTAITLHHAGNAETVAIFAGCQFFKFAESFA